jgi:hypothetical protein
VDPRKWKIADEAPDHREHSGTVFVHDTGASFTIEFHPLETRNTLLSCATTGAFSEDGTADWQASRIPEGSWLTLNSRPRSTRSQGGRRGTWSLVEDGG